MTEFISGILIGALLVFCRTEYEKIKSRLIGDGFSAEKNGETSQWTNLMNYDGTGRGQTSDEN